MLTPAFVLYSTFVRELYEGLYSDEESINRVLHPDDKVRADELALTEEVIQLYPVSLRAGGMPNEWACVFDCCAPSFDTAMRRADAALTKLQPLARRPSKFSDPRSEFVYGTGYGRIRVLFTLKTKPQASEEATP